MLRGRWGRSAAGEEGRAGARGHPQLSLPPAHHGARGAWRVCGTLGISHINVAGGFGQLVMAGAAPPPTGLGSACCPQTIAQPGTTAMRQWRRSPQTGPALGRE